MGLLLIDEAHLANPKLAAFIQSAREAGVWVYGFTATPNTWDSVTTEALFGEQLFSFSRYQGVESGVLTPWVTQWIPSTDTVEGIAQYLLSGAVNQKGSPLIDDLGIIYVPSTQEADQLADAINLERPGLAYAYHSQQGNTYKNNATILSLFSSDQRNGPRILVAVGMLREGFDVPHLNWVWLKYSSNILPRQQAILDQIVGRAIRNTERIPGKVAEIYCSDLQWAEAIPSFGSVRTSDQGTSFSGAELRPFVSQPEAEMHPIQIPYPRMPEESELPPSKRIRRAS